MYITICFEFEEWPDINPFDIETPYGKPETIARGNVFEELDQLRDELERLRSGLWFSEPEKLYEKGT